MLPIVEILKARQYAEVEYAPIKEFRGFFYQSGKANVRIPPAPHAALGHTQRYLVLQVRLRAPHPFTFTIRVRDSRGRLCTFAYSTEKARSRERPAPARFSVMLRLDVPGGTWAVVYFDMEALVREHCAPAAFQALQAIEIRKCATIGKIFAVDAPPARELAPELRLPPGVGSEVVLLPRGGGAPGPAAAARCSSAMAPAPAPLSPRRRGGPPATPGPAPRGRVGGRPPDLEGLPAAVTSARIAARPFSAHADPARRQRPPAPRSARRAASPRRQRPRTAAPRPAEEEEISDEDFFAGEAPVSDPEGEDDFDLVFIQALGCYYCPASQQYYEIAAHSA
jgi:hypothetical protein